MPVDLGGDIGLEGFSYWLRAYWTQVTGFALVAFGMTGVTYSRWLVSSDDLPLYPLGVVLVGWTAATLGRDVLKEAPKRQFEQPIYWLGQAAFVVGAGAPLFLGVARRGWVAPNILGAIEAVTLLLLGLIIGALTARRQRKAKGRSWPE